MTKRRPPDLSDFDTKRAHALFAALVACGEITQDTFAELAPYAVALWRFEHGEPEAVHMLLDVSLRGYPVPIGLQAFMADVATGRRKPGRKLGKCTAEQGLKAAFDLADVLDTEDKVRANAGAGADASRGAAMAAGHVTRIASGAGIVVRFKGAQEPADIIAESEARIKAAKARIAAGVGIEVSTLEKWERDLRDFLLRGGV